MYRKLLGLFFILYFILASTPVYARHYQDFEGDVPHWSEYGIRGETRQKIDALPNTAVQDLPIPILFGVDVSDLTQNFGDPRGDGTRTHEGLDILSPKGTPITSPTDAVITRTGNGPSSGLYVYTANPGGEVFAYMHLDRIGENVEEGGMLAPGDLIGYVGNTGNASGGPDHLHFEIRNNGATDPYPRLTETFSLQEKIESLNTILNLQDNPQNLAQFIVGEFGDELQDAEVQQISLPQSVAVLLESTTNSSPVNIPTPSSAKLVGGVISFDMDIGAQGAHVVWLQKFLIEANTGEDARYLGRTGATGYFGPITQRALAEYQAANNINPPVGYYGPITRSFITSHEVLVTTEPAEEIKPANFTRNLTIGSHGEDVRTLQIFLNTNGFILTQSGAGSPGNETEYFGKLTQDALVKYQTAQGITPAVGYFGPITRTYISSS